MVLFVSDIHFGREDRAAERRKEAELIACLRACEAEATHLYLVGDVFEEFIEYRYLVPKGFVRFQALLAEWTQRGVGVTYLVGNHDPWHRDYFTEELGVRVVFDAVVEAREGRRLYLTHGDGPGSSRRYRLLKPWLRHPVPVWLYRTLLPGDFGFRLARRVNRAQREDAVVPAHVAALRAEARRLLAAAPADVVVMGHTHQPELHAWPEGTYLNPGSWHYDRTFGRLQHDKLQLLRWNGTIAAELKPDTAT